MTSDDRTNAIADFSLESILNETWALLADGAQSLTSPFHFAQIATLRLKGAPTIRTVIIRDFRAPTRELVFFSDIRTQKSREIGEDPRLSIHFYDPTRKLQLRLDCMARIDHDTELATRYWQNNPLTSRKVYGQPLAPATPIATPEEAAFSRYDDALAFARFSVITASIFSLEWMLLREKGNLRAAFDWEAGGLRQSWLAP